MIIKIKKNQWFEQSVPIVDNAKNVHICNISTCQKHNYLGFDFHCFWCRLKCKGKQPIHCPLRFFPDQIEKKMNLKNGDGFYYIKCNVNEQESNNGYYEVDGSFCSLSCCYSFIIDNEYHPKYSRSKMLLHQITKQEIINEAPHWRLRKEYGGIYSKEEFKKLLLNEDTFTYHHAIVFVNHLFEKNLFQ
jgi:hypothetical protein